MRYEVKRVNTCMYGCMYVGICCSVLLTAASLRMYTSALSVSWFPSFWKHSVAIIIIISYTAWSHRDELDAENYAITWGTSCISFTLTLWKLIPTQIKICHEANTAWGWEGGETMTITDYGIMWCRVVWLTDTNIHANVINILTSHR